MNHKVDGRKFGRNTSHRIAMFRNMANQLIEHERIVTTIQKAKEVRRVVDRLITFGKDGSPASRRLVFNRTRNDQTVKKLFSSLAERYLERQGGYTRILKIANRRRGDAAAMAVIELVDRQIIASGKERIDEVVAPSAEVNTVIQPEAHQVENKPE
jgi:large subunit ribosomal protein L17